MLKYNDVRRIVLHNSAFIIHTFLMSNPLLRPNDPRFQRPDVYTAEGKNPFGESAAKNSPAAEGDVYAASAADEAQPYTAKYLVQQQSRAGLLIFLGGAAWGAAAVGAFSFSGWFDIGWLAPLLGVGPAGAAWFLAHEELKAIQAGAVASSAKEPARHAFWLGLTGLLACIAVVATMIYQQMHVLPDM